MATESKNREATGKRDLTYAEWRENVPGTALSLRWLEYRRAPRELGKTWPVVQLRSLVLAHVVPAKDLTADELTRAMAAEKPTVNLVTQIAAHVSFGCFFALIEPTFKRFLVQRLVTPPRAPGMANREQFVVGAMGQQWTGDDRDHNGRGDLDPYSVWHREAVPNSAYAMDVDYVEVRDGPVAVLEITRAYADDLHYFAFAYVSRSFVQMSALVEFAAALGVKSYLVVHASALDRFLVVEMTQKLISASDEWDRRRKALAKAGRDKNLTPRKADSIACRTAYNEFQREFISALAETTTLDFSESQYKNWLAALP